MRNPGPLLAWGTIGGWGSPEGGPSETYGENYGDKEEGAGNDPQPQAETPLPTQSAVGVGPATLFIFQLPQFGRGTRQGQTLLRSCAGRQNSCQIWIRAGWRRTWQRFRYTMRARSRELAKSTPMIMATSTSRIAEAAG